MTFQTITDSIARDPTDKYYVPRREYPQDTWPVGCNGGFYTTRVDTMKKIWGQAATGS